MRSPCEPDLCFAQSLGWCLPQRMLNQHGLNVRAQAWTGIDRRLWGDGCQFRPPTSGETALHSAQSAMGSTESLKVKVGEAASAICTAPPLRAKCSLLLSLAHVHPPFRRSLSNKATVLTPLEFGSSSRFTDYKAYRKQTLNFRPLLLLNSLHIKKKNQCKWGLYFKMTHKSPE